MTDTDILSILASAESLKSKYNATAVKVYFTSANEYTIKVIKDDKLFRTFRRGRG